jgi:hypothetical protein
MAQSAKPLSGPLSAISTVSLTAIAFRSFARMDYWWDHSNPVLALGNAVATFITGSMALAFIVSSFASKAGFITRLVSRDSPLVPTIVGLVLAVAGAYGMLVMVDAENVAIEWTFYGAVLAAGIFILRRTFSVEE